ncbi:excisionase, partial [Salmonella enterica subsp. enterica serovar Bareilly]
MQTIIYQIVPNDWVTEKLLIAATGLKPGTILRARIRSGLHGRESK